MSLCGICWGVWEITVETEMLLSVDLDLVVCVALLVVVIITVVIIGKRVKQATHYQG